MAIILELDSSKKVSILTKQKLLDFLGDLGGFKQAIDIIFSLFGIYVSSRLFKAELVTKLLKLEEEVESKLKLSMFHILCEPLIAFIIYTFCCECCYKTKTQTN